MFFCLMYKKPVKIQNAVNELRMACSLGKNRIFMSKLTSGGLTKNKMVTKAGTANEMAIMTYDNMRSFLIILVVPDKILTKI